MMIISYNINGIRAAIKKGLVNWLHAYAPDIVCLQELKANVDQFDVSVFEKLGYSCFWYSAKKKGYSGVAILSKIKPKNVVYGCGFNAFDDEGRSIRVDFNNLSVFSCHFPSGSSGEIRQAF